MSARAAFALALVVAVAAPVAAQRAIDTFASTTIAPAGADRWTVTGRLTIHGETRPATFSVTRRDGRYHGLVSLKQSDFGIQPIRIMGGTVKVKDELSVEFDIVALK